MSASAEMRQKIGQMFFIGFQGIDPADDLKKFISQNNIGGVILFDRNIEAPAQLGDLTNELQALMQKGPFEHQLFIGIDMEGGRVHRLKPPFTQWPAMNILGEIGSASLGFKFAETLGSELLSVGINVDFAPCVDILTNAQNAVIGDRALGTNEEVVSKMSSAIVRGFIKANIIPCVKHFPGHGDTLVDSHEDLPIVPHDLARLEGLEFLPFKKVFRARCCMVMTAHLKLQKIDPEWPATLSSIILTNLLREKLSFRHAIISDDMEMKAITKNYGVEEAAVQAVRAGCNILLYCHNLAIQQRAFEAVLAAVTDGKISKEQIERSYSIVSKIKKENLLPYKPVDVTTLSSTVGHPDHIKLAKQIARKEIPSGLAT